MDIDWGRLLQHAMPLLLYFLAVVLYVHSMGVTLITKTPMPAYVAATHFGDKKNRRIIIALPPGRLTVYGKSMIALLPWIWWAASAEAPESIYWKGLSFVALAILLPPILFPYLDAAHYLETRRERLGRWVLKVIDVALKKWTFAAIAVAILSLTPWNPASLYLYLPVDPQTIPPSANVLAITATIAIVLRSLFLASAFDLGPIATSINLTILFVVASSVFTLVWKISPEGYFYASVLMLGIGGGFLGALLERAVSVVSRE